MKQVGFYFNLIILKKMNANIFLISFTMDKCNDSHDIFFFLSFTCFYSSSPFDIYKRIWIMMIPCKETDTILNGAFSWTLVKTLAMAPPKLIKQVKKLSCAQCSCFWNSSKSEQLSKTAVSNTSNHNQKDQSDQWRELVLKQSTELLWPKLKQREVVEWNSNHKPHQDQSLDQKKQKFTKSWEGSFLSRQYTRVTLCNQPILAQMQQHSRPLTLFGAKGLVFAD